VAQLNLKQLIPDAEVLVALEPDELGLRLLPWLAHMPVGNLQLAYAIRELQQEYSGRGVGQVEIAVREAWAWLEGAALLVQSPQYSDTIKILSRRARKMAAGLDVRDTASARHLPKEALHSSIREDVWALFHRGKYDTAVFEAMKAVEVAVRDAAGLAQTDVGRGLMMKAFAPVDGPLTDTSVETGEREARALFFAGAMGSYKNPHSHRNVALDDPAETAEIILIANHLLRIVDARRAAKKPT
jgi:uncharacterized protein (TIGR02391 family)